MCIVIMVLLPDSARVDEIRTIFRHHGRPLDAEDNAYLTRQLHPTVRFYKSRGGYCDCDTGLGKGRWNAVSPAPDEQRKIERLRRKGWSENKIARALEQHAQADARDSTHQKRHVQEARDDVAHWQALLTDVLQSHATPYIGLLLHMHGDDRFTLTGLTHYGPEGLTPETLLDIEEDIVYVFHCKAKKPYDWV
jgi:DNA-binding transcriptional MerR regulator